MDAVDIVVIALVAVGAFIAGWIARGRGGAPAPEDPPPASGDTPDPEPPPSAPLFAAAAEPVRSAPEPQPDPAIATLRLLDRALAAYEAAVDRWIDEGQAITPGGRAALGEFDRAIQRVDAAAARIEEDGEPRFAALDALDALRDAVRLMQPYRDGAPLDAATSRELDKVETEAQEARDALAAATDH